MDSGKITRILEGTVSTFGGVYPINQLPAPTHLPFTIVCNTQKDCKKGEHWIAIHIDAARQGEYFDSYGLYPLHLEFKSYLDRYTRSWTYNGKRLQNLFSSTCGQYCIFYTIYRNRGHSMHDIVDVFTLDYHDNDVRVNAFVNRHFATHAQVYDLPFMFDM